MTSPLKTCPQCHADLDRHSHNMSCTHVDDLCREAKVAGQDITAIVDQAGAKWSTLRAMDPAELLREIQEGRVDLETPLGWAVERRLLRVGIDPRRRFVDEKELGECPF